MQLHKTFRVFVSSTFSDFHLERDALRTVWTRLQDFCAGHGVSFQIVDLRWGISPSLSNSHETLRACLQEIQHCQEISPRPNFIILTGQRYGWRPLPTCINEEEFEILCRHFASNNETSAIFRRWYRLDENIIPSHYILLSSNESGLTFEDWYRDEPILSTNLRQAAKIFKLPKERYLFSATHTEIIHGLFGSISAREHVFCFKRNINQTLPTPEKASKNYVDFASDSTIDTEAQGLLGELQENIQQYLPENHYYTYDVNWVEDSGGIDTSYLQSLTQDVEACLKNIIENELETIASDAFLAEENAAHITFASQRSRHFVSGSRDFELQAIAEMIVSISQQASLAPLVFTSVGGLGKSALMAKAFFDLKNSRPSKAIVIGRFIGATARSTEPTSFLEDLIREIEEAYGETTAPIPEGGVVKISEVLQNRLALATASKPLLLIIDGLDQFTTAPQVMNQLLPSKLPPHVAMILSTIVDIHVDLLKNRYPKAIFCSLTPLKVDACEALLASHLKSVNRTLSPSQQQQLIRNSEGSPLYTTLLVPIARSLSSWSPVPYFPTGVKEVAIKMVKFLGEKHYPTLIKRALGYLYTARYGLSERELLEILWRDPGVREEFEEIGKKTGQPEVNSLPQVVWSRAYADLSTYISEYKMDGEVLFQFFHRIFGDVAKQLNKRDIKTLHGRLADYFMSLPLYNSESQPNRRKLMELPWHLTHAGRYKKAEALITSFSFAMAKCQINRYEDWAEDFDRLLSCIEQPSPATKLWRAFLRERLHILRRGNDQWPAHKILLQLAMEHANNSSITASAEKWLKKGNGQWMWLRTASRPENYTTKSCTVTIEETCNINRFVPLDGSVLIGFGNNISLWDIKQGKQIRSYSEKHEGEIIGIVPISKRYFLAWSEDETASLWDIRYSNSIMTIDGLTRPFANCQHNGKGEVLLWTGNDSRIQYYPDDRSAYHYGNLTKEHIASDERVATICEKIRSFEFDLPFEIHDLSSLNKMIEIEGLYEVISSKLVVDLSSTAELSLLSDFYFGRCEMPEHLGNQNDSAGNLRRFNRNLVLQNFKGDSNNNFILFDTKKRKRVLFEGSPSEVLGAAFVGANEIVSWCYDEGIRIWDKSTAVCLNILSDHDSTISDLIMLHDDHAISCDFAGFLCLWDLRNRKCIAKKRAYDQALVVVSLRMSIVDDSTLVVWTHGNEIQVWSIDYRSNDSNGLEKKYSYKNEPKQSFHLIANVVPLPGGNLTWCYKGKVHLWNYLEGKKIAIEDGLSDSPDRVPSPTLTRINSFTLAVCLESKIAIVNIAPLKIDSMLKVGNSDIINLSPYQDSSIICCDGKIRLLSVGKTEAPNNLEFREAFLLSGKKHVIAYDISSDYDENYRIRVKVCEIATGCIVSDFLVSCTRFPEILVLDDRHFILNELPNRVTVYDALTGSCVRDASGEVTSVHELSSICRSSGLYTPKDSYKQKLERNLDVLELGFHDGGCIYNCGDATKVEWETDFGDLWVHGFADPCTIITSGGILNLYIGHKKCSPIDFFYHCIEVFRNKVGNKFVQWCLGSLAEAQMTQNRYAEAIEAYKKQAKGYDEINDTEGLSATLCRLGKAADRSGDIDYALRVYEVAEEVAIQSCFTKEWVVESMMAQATLQMKLNNPDEALACSIKCLAYWDEHGYDSGVRRTIMSQQTKLLNHIGEKENTHEE